MLWHGLVGDPNTMRPPQVFAVLRLLPGEGFFSVFWFYAFIYKGMRRLGNSWGLFCFKVLNVNWILLK
jgi:hypothetical protein